MRLKVDGTTGTVAIYDYTAGDDAPFTSPLSNVSRLQFHSDLDWVKVVDVRTGSVTLPAVNALLAAASGNLYTSDDDEVVLFAHGQSGVPYVEGRVTVLDGVSVNIPLGGSVPFQSFGGLPRWLHIGANATDVLLNWYLPAHRNKNYAAMTISYEIYVTNMVL